MKTVIKSRKFLGIVFTSLALVAGFYATTVQNAHASGTCNWNYQDLRYYCR